MALKNTTKQKYEQIKQRFDKHIAGFDTTNKTGVYLAFQTFLESANTKNTYRTFKAGIKYWIVGYCTQFNDPIIRKEKRAFFEKILEQINDEIIERELFLKKSKSSFFRKRQTIRNTGKINKNKLDKIFQNKNISNKYKSLILAMILTGCRPSEVKNLKINIFNSRIVFEKIVNKKTKLKVKKVKIEYNKTDIVNFLHQFGLSIDIFNDFYPYSQNGMRKIFQNISKKIKSRIIPYSCRNFFSMEMKKIYTNKIDVAKALGHEKETNIAYYARTNNNSTPPIIPIPEKIITNFKVKPAKEFDFRNHKKHKENIQNIIDLDN